MRQNDNYYPNVNGNIVISFIMYKLNLDYISARPCMPLVHLVNVLSFVEPNSLRDERKGFLFLSWSFSYRPQATREGHLSLVYILWHMNVYVCGRLRMDIEPANICQRTWHRRAATSQDSSLNQESLGHYILLHWLVQEQFLISIWHWYVVTTVKQ